MINVAAFFLFGFLLVVVQTVLFFKSRAVNTQTIVWIYRALCLYLAYILLGDIRLISTTREAYGKIPFFEMMITLRIIAQSHTRFLLLSVNGTALLALIAVATGMAPFPIELHLVLFLFWLHTMLYLSTPPSVVLLTSSRPSALFLREWLERSLFPYRVIVLLDSHAPYRAGYGWFQRNLLSWDNLRTYRKDWETTVHRLMQIAPFIALDAREATDGVVSEAEHIVAQGIQGKTVFITDVHGRAAVVEDANFHGTDPMLRFANIYQLPRVFKDLGLSRVIDPEENWLLNKYRRKGGMQI